MWSYYSSRTVGTVASRSATLGTTNDSHFTSIHNNATATASGTIVSGTIVTVSASTSAVSYGGSFSDAVYSTSQRHNIRSESFSSSNINSVGTTTFSAAQVTEQGLSISLLNGFSRQLFSTNATSAQVGDSSRFGTTYISVSDSYSEVSSSWWETFLTSRMTSTSAGGVTTARTSITQSGTTTDSRASFNYTTTTFTETTTSWRTTTSTRTSTFPTSTAGATTGSSSSSDTYTTQLTSSGTTTHTSYRTSWGTPPFYLDTIIEVATSEWAWEATTSGTGRVTALGASFTGTTLTFQGDSTSERADTYNVSAETDNATSTITYLSTTETTTTLAALRTSTQSTYSVAVGSNVGAPFTSTTGATISYTSVTTSSFAYTSSFTTTQEEIEQSDVFTRGSVTFSDTYTTSTSTGTSRTTLTDSFLNDDNMFFTGSTGYSESASDPTTTTSYAESGTTVHTGTFASLAFNLLNGSAVTADTPSYTAATIGRGFQDESFGRGFPIGTNLAIITGTTSTTTTSETTTLSASLALGWPHTDQTPILRAGESANIAGAVPTSLTNTRVTSRLGGVGWESASNTVITVTIGIHQMTTQNSLGATATTAKTWNITNSTFSLGPGQALAAEVVPLASILTNATYNPVLSFSANDPS